MPDGNPTHLEREQYMQRNSINHTAPGLSAGDFFEGIRAAGPQDLSGIKRLHQSLALDLGLLLNSLSDDDFASPFLRIFVIEREGQVGR